MTLKRYDGMKRGVALIPNLLTTANIFCGFFSIVQTIKGNYTFSVYLIILASLFDFLDGRVARMTGTQSDFGVEYDSLSDLTTFCMAPAVLLFKWSLFDFGNFGVAVCFLYFVCGALRLARYNVQAGGVEKTDFQGLPTPAAAGTVVTYLLFYRELFAEAPPPKHYPLLILMAGVALLMVSNIRYRTMKKAEQRFSFFHLVMAVSLFFFITAKHEITLFIFGLGYISLGIIGRLRDLNSKIQTAQEARRKEPTYHEHRTNRPRRFRRRGQGRRGEVKPAEARPEVAAQNLRAHAEVDNLLKLNKRNEL
jgi:CDP-diacylglycerol--serine O-phosphatidyltransferase